MPFDGSGVPPDRRERSPVPRRPVPADDPLTRREKLVAVLLGAALTALALGQCALLVMLRRG